MSRKPGPLVEQLIQSGGKITSIKQLDALIAEALSGKLNPIVDVNEFLRHPVAKSWVKAQVAAAVNAAVDKRLPQILAAAKKGIVPRKR